MRARSHDDLRDQEWLSLGSPPFAQPAALNGYLRGRIEAQKEGHEQSFR
jgi:hypothetical protein